jgi:hypothetical protein
MLLRAVAVADDRFETNAILGRDDGTDITGHAKGIAHPTAYETPTTVSLH